MPTCLHHPDIEAELTCDRCGRPFCERCVVAILGQRVCTGCKQESVQNLLQPRRHHPQALLSLVVPVVGYATCALTPITSLIGLYVGYKVLREMREQPQWSGRWIALAGMVVSGGTLAAWMIALVASLWLQRTG